MEYKCVYPYDENIIINPGAKVRILDDAEEDSLEAEGETLVRSRHSGSEGKYIEDIVTRCKTRFAVIELADGSRVLIRKKYIDRLFSPGDVVKISDEAEEDSPDAKDETLVISRHAGSEGKYIEDIVTQCKTRFSIIELADEQRVLIRKQYVELL